MCKLLQEPSFFSVPAAEYRLYPAMTLFSPVHFGLLFAAAPASTQGSMAQWAVLELLVVTLESAVPVKRVELALPVALTVLELQVEWALRAP